MWDDDFVQRGYRSYSKCSGNAARERKNWKQPPFAAFTFEEFEKRAQLEFLSVTDQINRVEHQDRFQELLSSPGCPPASLKKSDPEKYTEMKELHDYGTKEKRDVALAFQILFHADKRKKEERHEEIKRRCVQYILDHTLGGSIHRDGWMLPPPSTLFSAEELQEVLKGVAATPYAQPHYAWLEGVEE